MNPVTSPARPLSLDTVENETVYNLETLMSALYSKPSTATHPHTYIESEAVYPAPIISKRIVPTPDGRVRMIYVVCFEIDPMAGFSANGIWNHVYPMAQDLGS